MPHAKQPSWSPSTIRTTIVKLNTQPTTGSSYKIITEVSIYSKRLKMTVKIRPINVIHINVTKREIF